MRKILYIAFSLLIALPLAAAQNYTVVLDAGHGGKDPGAVGKFSYEKDLNLALVLKMGELLNEQYPDVNVVYTRSTDVFIPLQTRADIANKNNADLFISIHTNASASKDAKGVETFILGTEKMEKNLDVAMRENAVMKLEADYKTTYQGFDPNSIDSYIMFELMQNSFMDQSLQFAEQVQKRFVGHLNRSDRGVQQASFWVLLKTACPSILFEMGFISNPEEERFLNQDASIAQMANALVNAFGAYTHKQAVRKENLAIDTTKLAVETPNQTGETLARDYRTEIDSISNKGQQPRTYYALQICASRTLLDPTDPKLKGLTCEYRKVGDWYKYYAIVDTDRNKVVEKQKEIKSLFPDCWITKFEK
ncbi:MAG: N-acetylmuramoyl-L-alanine amidase [Paludibacteraceae bacterium]|nr:N-acetylmuramoyl-L-alanine amidase [Paludibacteraceae bacterium]